MIDYYVFRIEMGDGHTEVLRQELADGYQMMAKVLEFQAAGFTVRFAGREDSVPRIVQEGEEARGMLREMEGKRGGVIAAARPSEDPAERRFLENQRVLQAEGSGGPGGMTVGVFDTAGDFAKQIAALRAGRWTNFGERITEAQAAKILFAQDPTLFTRLRKAAHAATRERARKLHPKKS